MLLEACIQLFQPRQHDLHAMRQLLLGLSLCLAFIATAAPSKQPTEIQQLQQQVQTLEKELAIFQQVTASRQDGQDKRVGDIGIWTNQQANHMASIANVSTWVGIGITAIAVIAGFITLNATRRARKEARTAAEQWFKNNSSALELEIEGLRQQVTNHAEVTKKGMDKSAADAEAEAEKLRAIVANAAQQSIAPSDTSAPAQASPEAIQVVQAASQALESKPEIEFTAQEHYVRGFSEYNAKRFDSALVNFEKALEAAAQEQDTSEDVAKFMYALALTKGKLAKREDEIQVYDDLIEQFGSDTSPSVRAHVSSALLNKGFTLGHLNRNEDEIQVYDDLVQQFGRDTLPALRQHVSTALRNKGTTLVQLKRYEDAIKVFNDLIEQFSNDTSPAVREQLAKALLNKGVALGNLNRSKEEIKVYNDLIEQFGSNTSPAVRGQVAKAFLYNAITLDQLGRKKDAIEVLDLILQRYAEDSEPAIQESVAEAKTLVSKLKGGGDETAPPA